jgi:hypothetical protein
MTEVLQCLLCGTEEAQNIEFVNNCGPHIKCVRCGDFVSTTDAKVMLLDENLNSGILSGWVQEQNSLGIVPIIDGATIARLKMLKAPSFRERAERYLLAAIAGCAQLNTHFHSDDERFTGAAYCSTRKEMFVVRNYLIGEGLLHDSGQGLCTVTPKGYIEGDDLRARRTKSSQAFVAMWFASEMNPIYESGLSVGIERAGYKSVRVDKEEHANKIDDEIIAGIRRSAFLVADFTDHRAGVYFEAGFAMGLGLPVIWTCRKNDMGKLHFDIRQYNCIDWTSADELATRLQQRVEAILGRGPLINHQGTD